MAELKYHPGKWLRDDAAAALNALEDKYGPIVINRAGQTVAQQQAMIDKWDRGDRAGMFEPKRPARLSTHVMNGGEAVDVYNYTSDRAKLQEFGFEWYGPTDPVHYTFRGWKPSTPKPTKKEDEMFPAVLEIAGDSNAGKMLYNLSTGKAIRPISPAENTSLRRAEKLGACVYISVGVAEYKERGGK